MAGRENGAIREASPSLVAVTRKVQSRVMLSFDELPSTFAHDFEPMTPGTSAKRRSMTSAGGGGWGGGSSPTSSQRGVSRFYNNVITHSPPPASSIRSVSTKLSVVESKEYIGVSVVSPILDSASSSWNASSADRLYTSAVVGGVSPAISASSQNTSSTSAGDSHSLRRRSVVEADVEWSKRRQVSSLDRLFLHSLQLTPKTPSFSKKDCVSSLQTNVLHQNSTDCDAYTPAVRLLLVTLSHMMAMGSLPSVVRIVPMTDRVVLTIDTAELLDDVVDDSFTSSSAGMIKLIPSVGLHTRGSQSLLANATPIANPSSTSSSAFDGGSGAPSSSRASATMDLNVFPTFSSRRRTSRNEMVHTFNDVYGEPLLPTNQLRNVSDGDVVVAFALPGRTHPIHSIVSSPSYGDHLHHHPFEPTFAEGCYFQIFTGRHSSVLGMYGSGGGGDGGFDASTSMRLSELELAVDLHIRTRHLLRNEKAKMEDPSVPVQKYHPIDLCEDSLCEVRTPQEQARRVLGRRHGSAGHVVGGVVCSHDHYFAPLTWPLFQASLDAAMSITAHRKLLLSK